MSTRRASITMLVLATAYATHSALEYCHAKATGWRNVAGRCNITVPESVQPSPRLRPLSVRHGRDPETHVLTRWLSAYGRDCASCQRAFSPQGVSPSGRWRRRKPPDMREIHPCSVYCGPSVHVLAILRRSISFSIHFPDNIRCRIPPRYQTAFGYKVRSIYSTTRVNCLISRIFQALASSLLRCTSILSPNFPTAGIP